MLEIEHTFKHLASYLALGIEAGAALIIAFAVAESMVRAAAARMRNADPRAPERIRLGLGRWLALALEFELAADILGTAIAPTWDELGRVAAIIVLRTVLNFFLQREIKELAAEPALPTEPGAAPERA